MGGVGGGDVRGKHPPKSKDNERKQPPGSGGGGGGRGVGGVGGGDVRGDDHTNNVGVAAAASSTAAYRDEYGDEGTNDVGGAAAASLTAAYREKYGDDGNGIDGCGSDNDNVIDLLDDDPDLYLTPPNTNIDDDDYVDIDSDSEKEARTSFPKNKKPSKNLITGGPQPTDMPTCPTSHSGFCLGMKTSRTGRCSGSLLQEYILQSMQGSS